MTTGEKIQYYRKKLGLSQEELGQKLLVSRQTVSLWENGQTAPTIDNLVRLKEIFGVSVDELLGCESEEETPETEPDTPVPSESYKFDLTKADISSSFKSIIKMLFLPLLKTVLVLIAVLAVYIWIDMPDIAIGIFSGILGIIVFANVHQFFNYRKMWKKRTPEFEASEYEYRVFGDYFTVDVTLNGELISSEKIKFSSVQKIYDGGVFLLIIINGQIYLLKKDILISNSAFYIAMYDNPTDKANKNILKKLNISANVLLGLSLGILVFLFAVSDGYFTLRYFWLPVVLLPVPIALIVLGFKIKKLNAKYIKYIVIGTVVATALCIDFSVNYFISNDEIYEYDPVTYFTDNTNIALPESEEIIDSYTLEFADDTQPGYGGYIYFMSKVIFNDYSVYELENSLKHDTRWVNEFPEELADWIYPLKFDKKHQTADVMMLYNFHTGEYNTAPMDDDYNIFMAAFYHIEDNTLEIFEYEIDN